MSFKKTAVVTLEASSKGAFSVPFVEVFKCDPKYMAVMGSVQASGIGMIGSQNTPLTVILNGDPAGQVQVRVNSFNKTQVNAEVLANSLAPGQTSKISFLAQD